MRKAPQTVQVLNVDCHKDVSIYLDNVPGEHNSLKISNGTRFAVISQEGDAYIVAKDGKKFGVKQRHCKLLASAPLTQAPQA